MRKSIGLLWMIFFATLPLFSNTPDVSITSVLDKNTYAPNDTVICAVQVGIPTGFHLYSNPLGPGVGKPLKINVTNINGVTWFEARKQKPERFQPPIGDWVWAYKHDAFFFLIGRVSQQREGTIRDTVSFDGLICEKSCIPIEKKVPLLIKVVSERNADEAFMYAQDIRKEFFLAEKVPFEIQKKENGAQGVTNAIGLDLSGIATVEKKEADDIPTWEYEPQEQKVTLNIFLAIVLAFIAGIILNVMPCVLPVLGIKVLSFSQGAGSTRREAMTRSLFFSAGMVSIFWVLASFAAFAGLSWGEQFQNPNVLVGIVSIIFVFALGMFDVFIVLVPSGISALEQKNAKGKRYRDDFVKGMFTTILATPCSGPLLGATLAWTLLQTPVVIYAVFTALGLGMASPYFVFSASTRLMRLIPKPGAWMEDFKHVMGFLLFGFAVYLMIGLSPDMVLPTIAFCTFLAFCMMVYTRYAPFGSRFVRKLVVGVIVAGFGVFGWYLSFTVLHGSVSGSKKVATETTAGEWESFTPEKLRQAHARGQHVIVDFTANWCMNCQFNKISVYHTSEITKLIDQKNVLALKADLTQENPAAESLLHYLGSRSVPFLAIFPGDDPFRPIIMRDIVKKSSVESVLKGLAEREE